MFTFKLDAISKSLSKSFKVHKFSTVSSSTQSVSSAYYKCKISISSLPTLKPLNKFNATVFRMNPLKQNPTLTNIYSKKSQSTKSYTCSKSTLKIKHSFLNFLAKSTNSFITITPST